MWIEISAEAKELYEHAVSLPSRGVWIEIVVSRIVSRRAVSLPSRGVWIEIILVFYTISRRPVAPLAGSVD